MRNETLRKTRVSDPQIAEHVRELVRRMDLSFDSGRVRAVLGRRANSPMTRGGDPATPTRNRAANSSDRRG
ncbi:hypothetical protein N0B44_01070 [Roseibacterium beibuensis]|uniref:Uncharacterized protein n=1 Tax=[Roseibacterium] beibuensis TaxID=1193142 RepID=A0ABP9L4L5_9RHOB|nr:hypothetical protein [Roseibacterium beibuensis]MCS6621492.1 hypothetical protein [Roseibacterium beibuensis]